MRRFEIALVLAITLAGLALRGAFPSRAAIEHFDEGVYATRLWFAAGDDAPYPDRHLYAPPLVPWMVRWSIDLFGPGLWGAMLPAVVFGTLTIPLVWWTARRWFGPAAGLAGAVLAAGSDFHVLYSRTALTDVPLCFWLLAAVYCAWESFRAGSFRWAIAAGVTAGLAWWTKYNGWLAVVIAGAGLLPWLAAEWLRRRRSSVGRTSSPSDSDAGGAANGAAPAAAGSQPRSTRGADGLEVRPTEGGAAGSLRRIAACAGVLAAVACGVWSPVLLGLREFGGYSAVAANHQQYVVGIAGWWESLRQQAANHWYLDGVLSWGAAGLAFAVPIVWRLGARRGVTPAGCAGTLSLAGLAAGAAAARSSSLVLFVFAVGGLLNQLLPPASSPAVRPLPDRSRRLASWLAVAWFAGLLVATPFYYGYSRLTLPWLVAAWIGTAAAVQWAATARWWDRAASPRSRTVLALLAALVFLVLGVPHDLASWERVRRGRIVGWQDRTALARLAEQTFRWADLTTREAGGGPRPAVRFVFYVYAEPAIVFHLTERGAVAQPASNLDFVHAAAARPQTKTFFVAGLHAWRTPEFEQQWKRHGERFELIAESRYTPSGLVLLDLHSSLEPDLLHVRWPDWASNSVYYGRITEPVRLYRVR
ncbi:MAG TPA: glycosyltransferase family 39 protein [Planctomycetaceae bacterium]|nr:glycosyltransferase family 39 protein [Planctomycetaceae bacterium]